MYHPMLAIALLLVSGSLTPAWSAVIDVPPGNGTLAGAVGAASNGDTLVLRTGAYTGSVTVNKSLTLRANAYGAEASVSSFTIAGAGISVTVQGLVFPSGLWVYQAADVKILENTFGGNIDVSGYKTSEGDGKLTIIGNHLTSGNISTIQSEGFYVAGNVLDNGYIAAHVSGWIVGNQVTYFSSSYPIYVTVGPAQVIGNRITVSANTANNLYGIYSSASPSLIAGNIVTVNNSYDVNYSSTMRGIYCSTTLCTVINNVVTGSAVKFSSDSVGISANGRILGNIVYNLPFNAIYKHSAGTEVANNLCYLNNPNCGTANGNLEADPKFSDLINFQLAADSPAINAGPSSLSYADLDRTRNDMGAYGGPWSIGQYDTQRDPANFAPYVFPLFKANSSVSDGSLEIFALGVARLR